MHGSSAGDVILMRLDFLPNNDIAPARRFRILKAQERGALWVKEWQAGVTHVIVDNTLSYGDVLRFLKISVLPVSEPTLSCYQSSFQIARNHTGQRALSTRLHDVQVLSEPCAKKIPA